jgi:hypothetical protein
MVFLEAKRSHQGLDNHHWVLPINPHHQVNLHQGLGLNPRPHLGSYPPAAAWLLTRVWYQQACR